MTSNVDDCPTVMASIELPWEVGNITSVASSYPESTAAAEQPYFEGGIIAAADWDRGGWNIAYSDGSTASLSKSEFLNNKFDRPGLIRLVVESAHLIPRAEKNPSQAQIYSAAELNAWKPCVDVRLFPGRLARKVAKFAGNFSGDKAIKSRDSESLLFYVTKKNPGLPRFIAPKDNVRSGSWERRNALREEINITFNQLRSSWKEMTTAEKYASGPVNHCRELLEAQWDNIPQDVKNQFKLTEYCSTGRVKFGSFSQCMGLYVCLYDDQQELRTRSDGKFIGINYLQREVIGLHMHGLGNIIRALFYWDGYKPDAGRTLSQNTQNIVKLMKLMRDANNLVLPSNTAHTSVPYAAAKQDL